MLGETDMFENLEVLNKENHADLRFQPASGYGFAADLSVAPLSAAEVPRAAKHYPIVFPVKDSLIPQALLSLQKGKNAFVDAEGRWTVPYVPAHVRRYPFILAKGRTAEEFAICIDRDAPHFQEGQGDPLFTANGEAAEILTKAQEFLGRLQQELMATERLLKPLEEKGVITEQRFNLEADGKKHQVAGFRGIDRNKLVELDDATLAEWVRNGLMGIVDATLHSLENVQRMGRWREPPAA